MLKVHLLVTRAQTFTSTLHVIDCCKNKPDVKKHAYKEPNKLKVRKLVLSH